MDVVVVVVALALNIVVPWAVVRWDMNRLSPEQLDRTWNDASLWSAIVAFGPLALPFHFVKSRRSLLGVLLGVGALVVAYVAISLVLFMVTTLAEVFV